MGEWELAHGASSIACVLGRVPRAMPVGIYILKMENESPNISKWLKAYQGELFTCPATLLTEPTYYPPLLRRALEMAEVETPKTHVTSASGRNCP